MKGLEIFWIRHSVSRANAENILEKIINNTLLYYSSKDPEIVPDAESGSCYLGKRLNKDVSESKLVGCSEMRRAIQTAILMFPKQFKAGKLKVLPGIQEKGFGASNIAVSIEANKKFLIKWCVKMKKKSECERFNEIFKNNEEIEKSVNKIYSDLDFPQFNSIREEKNTRESQFLNCLIPYLEKKKIKKIPIVSHSNYIKEEIMVKDLIRRMETKYLRRDLKLNNNQILKKEYEYNKKKIYVRDQVIYDFGCVYDDRIVDCYH